MGRSDVHAWLQGHGAYNEGVELLKRHARPGALSNVFLSMLSNGETSYSRRRLFQALTDLVTEAIADQQQQDATIKGEEFKPRTEFVLLLRSPRNDGIDRSRLTPDLLQLHDQVKRSYARLSHLHAQLELLPSDGMRLSHAMEIDDLDVFIVEAYVRLDHFQAHGVDPAAPKQLTREELHRELLNHRSYVAKPANKEKRPDEVARRAARIKEIERILNATV